VRPHVADRARPDLRAGHVAVRGVLPGEADAAVVLHVDLGVLDRGVGGDGAGRVGVERTRRAARRARPAPRSAPGSSPPRPARPCRRSGASRPGRRRSGVPNCSRSFAYCGRLLGGGCGDAGELGAHQHRRPLAQGGRVVEVAQHPRRGHGADGEGHLHGRATPWARPGRRSTTTAAPPPASTSTRSAPPWSVTRNVPDTLGPALASRSPWGSARATSFEPSRIDPAGRSTRPARPAGRRAPSPGTGQVWRERRAARRAAPPRPGSSRRRRGPR
jgi:hypothetical protein